MRKRLLSLLLALVLLCSVLPAANATDLYYGAVALATSTYPVEGGNLYFDSRQHAIVHCDQTVTAADIPAEIEGVPVERIPSQAFINCTELTSLTIPETVTYIGDSAFEGCKKLTAVTLPDNLSQLGKRAFSGTGCIRRGENAYYVDHWLVQVLEPKAWTAPICIEEGTVGVADHALHFPDLREFHQDIRFPSTLRYLSIDAGDPSRCRKNFFAENGKLRLDGSFLLTADGKTLVRYYSLLNVDKEGKPLPVCIIPDGVEHIGAGAFRGAEGVKYIYMPDSVVSIGMLCVTSQDTEHIRFSPNLKTIDDFAFVLSGLREADLGDNLVSIGRYAFLDNVFMETLVLPATLKTVDEAAFYNCNALKGIYFQGDAPDFGPHALSKGSDLQCYYVFQRDGSETPINKDVMLYYKESAVGFEALADYSTALWPQGAHCHSYQLIQTTPDCFQTGEETLICGCGDRIALRTLYFIGHQYNVYGGSCIHCGMPSTIQDVKDSDWFARSVAYSFRNGLMEGTGKGTFSPGIPMTRAMLVTVLHRNAGKPNGDANEFTDVAAGQWYTDAVAWAAKSGIVNGVGSGRFDPDGSVTREQIAVILFRRAGSEGRSTEQRSSLDAFADSSNVSSYAVDALQWAVAEGVMTGSSDGGKLYLNPQGKATRAEVATLLMRYIENILK